MPADRDRSQSSTTLGPRFVRAVEWASELHGAQTRKGTDVPYVAHLLDVAALVLQDGGSETEAIAALLHDAIEDARIKPKKIRRRFGRKVARIVQGCTETLRRRTPDQEARAARRVDVATPASRSRSSTCRDPATPTPVLRVTRRRRARERALDRRRPPPERARDVAALPRRRRRPALVLPLVVADARRTPPRPAQRRAPRHGPRDGGAGGLVVRRRRPATGRALIRSARRSPGRRHRGTREAPAATHRPRRPCAARRAGPAVSAGREPSAGRAGSVTP